MNKDVFRGVIIFLSSILCIWAYPGHSGPVPVVVRSTASVYADSIAFIAKKDKKSSTLIVFRGPWTEKRVSSSRGPVFSGLDPVKDRPFLFYVNPKTKILLVSALIGAKKPGTELFVVTWEKKTAKERPIGSWDKYGVLRTGKW